MTTSNLSAVASTEAKAYPNFKDFNQVVVEGRVQHSEVKAGEYGEYVSVTVITTLKDGEQGIAVTFRSSNGILKLAKGGHLMNGRRVHITGQISGFNTHYVNKDGVIVQLTRPRMDLTSPALTLGAKPKSAVA